MARRGVKHEVARRIVSLAERQHGVIAVWQLPELGLTWEQVRGRVRAGWLRRLHAGVYAVAGRPLSQRGRWLGAVLACGRGAVLSHNDAAMLWRLLGPTEGPVHVSVPAEGGRGPRPGIKIHRRRGLSPTDTTVRTAIPVTTPARTILDLATVIGRRPLERAIDEAERLRLCGGDDLAVLVERHRGRAGTALVAGVLDSHRAGSTATRSELEERFLSLCRERGLAQPLVNATLLGLTVDFFWPPSLVAEVDGAASHLTRRAFQNDRDRDSLLVAHGYRVLRFTWWDLTRRPGVVADRLGRAVAG